MNPIQELEELRETRFVWDVIGISEVRRPEECLTTLQSGHLLYLSKANKGQAGVGFLINRKWKDHIVRVNSISPRVAELVLCITKRYKLKLVQVYAPTTSNSDEDINDLYTDVDETLGKPNHYTIVMGDCNAHIGKRTNLMETATGKCGLGLRNERGDTLVEWATSRKYRIMNTMFQKKAGRRWTWKTPKGCNEDRSWVLLTNRPDIVTDVTVINQVNIGSDHRLVMSNIKLDIEMERKTLMTKRPHKEDRIQTWIKNPIRDTTRTRRHRHHVRNHPKESKRGHQRNTIMRSYEKRSWHQRAWRNPKNADARPRQTDHTLGQAG